MFRRKDKVDKPINFLAASKDCRIRAIYHTDHAKFSDYGFSMVLKNTVETEILNNRLRKLNQKFGPEKLGLCVDMLYLHPNKEDCEIIIKELISYEPKIKNSVYELCRKFRIDPALGMSLEQLKKETISDAISIVTERQDYGCYDLIWQLATFYFQEIINKESKYQINHNDLYGLLQDISEKNPHYHHAQDMCVDLLMLFHFDKDDKFKYLEIEFTHALSGTRPELTDRLFDELCGYPLSDKVCVRNIQGDPETLLALASQVRDLRQQVNDTHHSMKIKRTSNGFFNEKQNEQDDSVNRDRMLGMRTFN